ncbi:MAG TPA: DUF302 domain-containing protein [Ktedonobacteraceae bacterium]|jgi:uncharacterized protein (DUF302 family)
MSSTRQIAIEHVVIASNQPYKKVLEGLENRLGSVEGWRAISRRVQAMVTVQLSWEQFEAEAARNLGPHDFLLFNTVEHTPLLTLAGKTSRAIQYLVGNPLLAMRMSRFLPEIALYAPLRLVVYENEADNTFVAYDNFVSLLAQYHHEEITRVAQIVEQKLEALLAEVTQ